MQHEVRVADVDVAARSTVAVDASRARRRRPWPAPMSTVARCVPGSSVGSTRTRPDAGVGGDVTIVAGSRCRRATTAWARQRMPLPLISARLPSALNSVHRRRPAPSPSRGPGVTAQQPVGADAGMAIAQARAPARPSTGAGAVESSSSDEEVVAEAVVLGQLHADSSLPGAGDAMSSDGIPRADRLRRGATRCVDRGGTTLAGGGRTGGCGEWPGRAPRPAWRRRRGGPAAPGSRAPGPAVRESPSGRARSRRTSSRKPVVELAPVARLDAGGDDRRTGARCRRGGTVSAGRPASPGPNDENGRPLPSVTSRARTTRRRLVGFHPGGAERDRAPRSRSCRTLVSGSSSSSAPRLRDTGRGWSRPSTAAPQVETGAPDEQGAMPARFDAGERIGERRAGSERR